MRIIVEERHGRWFAWYENRPDVATAGKTPADAVFRLAGPERKPTRRDDKPQSWRDRPPLL